MRTRPRGRRWSFLWGTIRVRVMPKRTREPHGHANAGAVGEAPCGARSARGSGRNGRGGANASTSTEAFGEVPYGARSVRGVRRKGRSGPAPAPLLGRRWNSL